jgi:hypothetical protein
MLRVRQILVGLLAVPLAATASPGAEPYNPFPPNVLRPGYYAGLLYEGAARLKKYEVVQMASAIVADGDMGPNSAWFHPAQSRYGWKWLAERYDRNRNGEISEDEFPDGEKAAELRRLFERLDRDRDGKLTAADFDWTDRAPYVRELMQASGWLRALGGDNGGKITREGWDRTFDRLSKGKGFITPEDLREQLVPPPRRPQAAQGGGPSQAVLLKGLIDGDVGSPFEGPSVGARAPEFRLKTFDGKSEIALSDLRGKPTVLVFGSFT